MDDGVDILPHHIFSLFQKVAILLDAKSQEYNIIISYKEGVAKLYFNSKKNKREKHKNIFSLIDKLTNNFQEKSGSFAFWLIVPVLTFFLVWNILPTLWMIGLGFYKYVLTSSEGIKFVGLRNFVNIFNNKDVWYSFSRTFRYVFFGVGIQTILGLIFGFMFWGSEKMPGRRLALTLLFSPMVIAPVAAGTYFKLIYDPTLGIVNYLTNQWFGVAINFLGNAKLAFWSVLLVDTWMWTPFMILMTLAALGAVPKAELEAAEVDRLPWIKRFFYIILPHGKFILMLGILLRTIDSFKTMDLVYVMTSGGPGDTTELMGIYLYRKAFLAFTMGNSSALSLICLLIAIAFTSIYLYILKSKRRNEVTL